MNNRKKLIELFFPFILIFILVHSVSAQGNETKGQHENGITASMNYTFLEQSQQGEVSKEDIIIEAQRSLDRSLSILNIVATLMGVLVGMFAFIVAIAAATGYFGFKREIDKMLEIKKNFEQDADVVKRNVATINELKSSAEKIVGSMRSELTKLPQLSLTEMPSSEVLQKLDEFSRRIDILEILGVSLKYEDYYNRGIDLYYKGKYESAIKAFEKAIGLKSDYSDAWINKGAVLIKLGKHDEAIKAFEKAIELKPDYADAWINKGIALIKLDRHDEAIKAFEKAIELKPDYADAWINKGIALTELGRHDEAIKTFEKVVELKPDHARTWFNLACNYSIKDKKEKALFSLKKAIEIDASFKEMAKKDKDFEKLWEDENFIKLFR